MLTFEKQRSLGGQREAEGLSRENKVDAALFVFCRTPEARQQLLQIQADLWFASGVWQGIRERSPMGYPVSITGISIIRRPDSGRSVSALWNGCSDTFGLGVVLCASTLLLVLGFFLNKSSTYNIEQKFTIPTLVEGDHRAWGKARCFPNKA